MKRFSMALLALTMLSTPALAQTNYQDTQLDRQAVHSDNQADQAARQQLRSDEKAGNTSAIANDKSTLHTDHQNDKAAHENLNQQKQTDQEDHKGKHHHHKHDDQNGNH